jgi:16S rRNA (cytidine1402-2'-O)-methyltransferase
MLAVGLAGWEFQDCMQEKSISMHGSSAASGQGGLFLVGTPIGNLEDITLRALRTLREADLIACEDTRQTQKLLNHFEIGTRTTSYHEHNEITKAAELVRRMEEGMRIALVTDAGIPGISDPGYRLVELSIRHRIPVTPVPGPSAVVTALAVSGLPTHAFQFVGFLPPKPTQRRRFLGQLAESQVTTIAFESPRRVLAALRDVQTVLGDRPVAVARELTKIHEEILRGTCSEVIAKLEERKVIPGEITLILGPGEPEGTAQTDDANRDLPVKERVRQLVDEQEMTRMEALKVVARERGISKSKAYRQFES